MKVPQWLKYLNNRADAFIYDQLTIYRNVEANPTTLNALYIENQEAENWEQPSN